MASLFSLLKRTMRRSARKVHNELKLTITMEDQYLSFRVLREGSHAPLRFPLSLSIGDIQAQPDMIAKLALLEELWESGYLQEEKGTYHLVYDHVYELEAEERELLGLPAQPVQLDLKLGNKGIIGTSHFQFQLEKHFQDWKHLERTAKQQGPFIILANGQTLMMDKEQYEFEKHLQQMPDPKDKEHIFRFIAETRKKAQQLKIPLVDYIEKQNYVFVDQLDLDLTYENQVLQVYPKYMTSEQIDNKTLREMARNELVYYATPNGPKVFVQPEIAHQARQVNNIGELKGADIPKFIENPSSFLQGINLDLSLFSERVKSLGLKVYRAQPYVHAQETDRGWFEIEHGFELVDEEGEKYSEDYDAQQFLQQIQKAHEEGEEYIEWNGKWIKVPEQANQFIAASKRLIDEIEDTNRVDYSRLPLVLEIYENVTQLEYNKPILEIQREMMDQGVLDRQPPSLFNGELKPFQSQGFVWMKSLYYRNVGGLLADDMGLGKTVQVIAFFTYLKNRGELSPSLIVVPKTLIDNWFNELKKFAPSLLQSTYIYHGPEARNKAIDFNSFDLVITTYETLIRQQIEMGQVDWQVVVCDEAQKFKNPTTSTSRVVKALKSKCRLALTGTPVENGLSELWSIMDFVQPGLLGSLNEFRKIFIDPLQEGVQEGANIQEIEQRLFARIAPVYLRRTKHGELGDQLPKKEIELISVPMGRDQRELYKQVLVQVKNKEIQPIKAIGELKKICSHPALYSEEYLSLPIEQIPKLSVTIDILKRIQDQQEKALIFTEYRLMQGILKRHIAELFNLNPAIINGMTPARQSIVDHFNKQPGFGVLILSPRSAGTGLTITGANHVIHYTRWWNPAVENQATDRAYRIGQQKDVKVYYPVVEDGEGLLARGTVEQIVHRIMEEKMDLAKSVIVPSDKLNINIEKEVMQCLAMH